MWHARYDIPVSFYTAQKGAHVSEYPSTKRADPHASATVPSTTTAMPDSVSCVGEVSVVEAQYCLVSSMEPELPHTILLHPSEWRPELAMLGALEDGWHSHSTGHKRNTPANTTRHLAWESVQPGLNICFSLAKTRDGRFLALRAFPLPRSSDNTGHNSSGLDAPREHRGGLCSSAQNASHSKQNGESPGSGGAPRTTDCGGALDALRNVQARPGLCSVNFAQRTVSSIALESKPSTFTVSNRFAGFSASDDEQDEESC